MKIRLNMSKCLPAFVKSSVLAGMLATSGGASAGLIDVFETQNFRFFPVTTTDHSGGGSTSTWQNMSLSFGGADAIHGQLQSVMIWLTSKWDVHSDLWVTNGYGTGKATTRLWANVGGASLVQTNKTYTRCYEAGSGCDTTHAEWGAFMAPDAMFNLSGIGLNYFESAFAVDLKKRNVATAWANRSNATATVTNRNNGWRGDVHVKYTYNQVPEPSALSLLALGGVLMGFSVYRRRKS